MAGACASPLSSSSDILLGGATPGALKGHLHQDDAVLAVHVGSGRVVRRAPSDAAITHMRKSGRYVCCGTSQGTVQLRDPRSLHVEHKLSAHHGGLIDIQADQHLIYSIGWTLRQGRRVAESFIKAHDLRSMQALVPIPMTAPGGPAWLAIHPKRPSLLAVATPQSQFQMVDMTNPGLSQFYAFSSNAYVTSMAFSSSAEALAFGESDGTVRLWSTASGSTLPRFNAYPTAPVQMPDRVPPPPSVEWSDDTPLSSVGMPHYDKPLLSRLEYDKLWTNASPLFTMQAKHDDKLLTEHAQSVQGLQYAPLPRPWRGMRNKLVATDHVESRLDRHGKLKPGAAARIRSGAQGTRRVPVVVRSSDAEAMPEHYGAVTIHYSRFGVEDFDFAFYNKTPYSGLETDIGASYANAYLQALHYAVPFRAFAKRHILMACDVDDCLLCEAGFLFRMLEDARGVHCQASNLLRVLARQPAAASHGLLDDAQNDATYAHMVQKLNHYFLEQASQRALHTGTSLALPPTQLPLCANPTAWSSRAHAVCRACGHMTRRQHLLHCVDLVYPTGAAGSYDFAALLGATLRRETVTKLACRQCHTPYVPHQSWRSVASSDALPALLSVNAAVASSEHLAHWIRKPGEPAFLPARLAIQAHHGQLAVHRWADDEALPPQAAGYVLRAVVIQAQSDHDAPHLVALVRVPRDEGDEWVLFNDFAVRPIDEAEALRFDAAWKVPAVLLWERIDAAAEAHAQQLAHAASSLRPDMSLLFHDWNMATHRKDALLRHHVLTPDELPTPGTLVAIDAEFVALAHEHLEVFSDGSRSLVQPSHLALARVSVVRGQGPMEGEPFIDDHISTTERVVDYLTQYSGIQRA